MDEMLNLLDTVLHSDCQDVVFRAFLNACSDQQVFVNKASTAIQPILSKINSKLNSANSRFEGLLLLKTYLPQCSIDIFGENALSWMQQCLKAGEIGQNGYEASNTAYQVLKMLLHMSENLPEMRRSISGMIVPKIIENIQQLNPQEVSLSMLECLELLMHHYGSACGQQKNVLEKCILQYIDCKESDVMKRIARCLAYLPLLGGGGSLGTSHISHWNHYQQKLCATLHGILDELFDDIREIPHSYSCVKSQKLDLPVIKETSPLMRVHHLITRFINISKCLQAVLMSEFPVEKTVLPDAILGVVCRGLAVNNRSLGKKMSPDTLMIGAMLPQVHIMHLRLLDSLIICCRRNLLPYAPVICKLVLQILKWTSEEKWIYGVEKPYCLLREAACNSLKLWLQVSNSGSCVELIADQLIPLLLQDIWFEKETVTLIAQNSGKNNKLQRKFLGQEQMSAMNVRNLKRHIPNKTANNRVCRAALQLLQWVLHSAAPFLKPSLHRLLQQKTIGLLFEIQRASKPEDLPVPFFEPTCRMELYQLLHTLNLEPHTIWPPPTQYALCILAAGRSDPDMKVSAFCTTSLAAIEKVIHPCSGTLQFPVALEEMLDSTKNYKHEYIIPVSEHSISNGNIFERNDSAQKDLTVNDIQIKEVTKLSKEKFNSSGDVEIIVEQQEQGKKKIDEEEDEYVESEGSVLPDDVSVMSENSNEEENVPKDFVEKRFQEEEEEDDDDIVEIAESDSENENMNNETDLKHGHKQNDNARKIKVNDCNSEEDKKQSTSFVRCRNDLQSNQSYADGKQLQMNKGSKLPTQENLNTRSKIAARDIREKNAIVMDLEIPTLHAKHQRGRHDDEIDEIDDDIEEFGNVEEEEEEEEMEEEEDVDDEDDEIDDEDGDDDYEDEPNRKKMKLDSPISIKIKSVKEFSEYQENDLDDKTDPLKNDDENDVDVLQLNGVAEESVEVPEEEMLKSFVDVLAE